MDTENRNENGLFSLYERLLILYPRQYRREYGELMLDMIGDMLTDTSSKAERRALWRRLYLDLFLNAGRERYRTFEGALNTDGERRFKQAAYISLLLFVVALVINVGTHVAAQVGYLRANIGLYVLVITIVFPALSALIALGALKAVKWHSGDLPKRQARHGRVLAFSAVCSLLILSIASASLLLARELNPS